MVGHTTKQIMHGRSCDIQMMILGWKCRTRAAPDIFNLGSIIFGCRTTVHHLYNVCVRVCLSVTSRSCRNGWTNRAAFWQGSFYRPILHSVIRKLWISKTKSASLWNFVLNSGLGNFATNFAIFEACYQLSSRKMAAQSVINWTVVGQPSWQYLRAPTLGRSQWSSSCLRHDSVARVY